jgi:hypothetical protein
MIITILWRWKWKALTSLEPIATRSNGKTSNKHGFIASGQPKDDFNATVPSAMGSKIPAYFEI